MVMFWKQSAMVSEKTYPRVAGELGNVPDMGVTFARMTDQIYVRKKRKKK